MSAETAMRTTRTGHALRRGIAAALLGWLGCALATVALAQTANSLDNVTVSRASSGRVVVRFQLKAPPANPPAGFSITSPPRIALDFLDTTNALGATQRAGRRSRAAQPQRHPGRQPHARGVQPQQAADVRDRGRGQHGDRDPDRPGGGRARARTPFSASPKRKPARRRSMRCATSTSAAAAMAKAGSSSTCPTARPGIDIRQQGRTLMVDFLKTSVPRNLERRLDVADFGTPVVDRRHFRAGRERPDGHRAEGAVGAFGLPDRQPVHPRGEADPRRSRTS